jgi:hypothetical protein
MFSELSNDCMKKVLDERFMLTFSPDEDNRLKLSGKSEAHVEIEGIYIKPHEILSKFRKDSVKHSLPETGRIMELISRTAMLEIKLPVSYYI